MIKAIIIDDELDAIETLQWKLTNYCPAVEIIASFNNPIEGLTYINSNPLDLLFLDIEMSSMSGFDVLQNTKNLTFDVIFTTAYDEYGIRAIKYSALDYLLKPIQVDELAEAIQKFRKKNKPNILPEQLEVLFQSLNKEDLSSQKIALSTKESIELVKPKDIIMCQSDDNYTMVHMLGRKKLISKTLKDFEELLTPHAFVRTHQSFLVNLDHIKEYMRQDGGYLIMSNDIKVPVSRNKKEGLMKYF